MSEQLLRTDIGRFCRDPLGYAMYAFPWQEQGELADSSGPRQWQRDVLAEIGAHLQSDSWATPLQLAIASGHGIGKTALIAMVCKWAVDTCEDCRVVVTANTESQLQTKTWPEVCKWFGMSITTHWFNVGATTISVKDKEHERLWRIDRIAWSENNTEAFAGLHNRGKRILVVYDEASAISDKIWEVTEGALTDENTEIIWLAFGNPTKNTGRFRECFGRYKHRWGTRHIDSRGIEGTNKEQLDKWVADYGEDSDFVRVRVKGEFPRAGGNQFIPADIVSVARKRMLPVETYERMPKIISCDVARFGDDRTIIGLRQGLRWQTLAKLRGQDAVNVAGHIQEQIVLHKARMVVIDGDGNGGPVVDILRKNMVEWVKQPEHRLVEFHGGARPADPDMYFNRRAEVWGLMKGWLNGGGDIPDDPELEMDLTTPEYGFSGKNQIQLEKKDDMKKRGMSSPDDGDCLAMSFAFNAPAKTHREKVEEELAATPDPMANYLIQLREHARQEKQADGGEWWK